MLKYKQGMTTVLVDEDKTVVKNPTGITHVETNVDQIFGIGEFDKLVEHKYVEENRGYRNGYTLISGYTPKKSQADLKDSGKERLSAKDLMKDYFDNE